MGAIGGGIGTALLISDLGRKEPVSRYAARVPAQFAHERRLVGAGAGDAALGRFGAAHLSRGWLW